MTVEDICKQVRWCIDEEAINGSDLAAAMDSGNDTTLMNNLIKAKINDALRWVCLYSPAEQLSGGVDGDTNGINILVDETNISPNNGRIKMGKGFIRLVRIKGTDWHRAVMGESLLKEDSEEYLQLNDSNGAEATVDRPQAALIEKTEKEIEVWPKTGTFELTKLMMPSYETLSSISDSTVVNLPALLVSSYIYYLAYLVLIAYGDQRADSMLVVAKQHLGLTDDRQRA